MGKALCASTAWMQPDSEFGMTQFRVLARCEAHVAGKNELAAHATHAATDSCETDNRHLRKPHERVHQNGEARGSQSRHDVPELAREIEVRQIKVGKRTLEYNHPQSFSHLHPDKKVLKSLKNIPIDDIEGWMVEHRSPVPRCLLNHSDRCRIRIGHDSFLL